MIIWSDTAGLLLWRPRMHRRQSDGRTYARAAAGAQDSTTVLLTAVPQELRCFVPAL
eukprot:SAG31_NODE_33649_length_341_cov_0.987603_1_plen_56_part_01